MHYDQKEVERKRLYKLVDQMVESIYDDDPNRPEDLRLDAAVIVTAHIWTESDGSEAEGVGVYSESKKHYATRGLLERGVDRVKLVGESGDAW